MARQQVGIGCSHEDFRKLTTDGIIRRDLFPDVPPRTEYSVTDLGKTLLPHVEALINWGRENFDYIMSNRQNSK